MKRLLVLAVVLGLSGCTAINDIFDPITPEDKALLEESSLNFEPLPIIDVSKMEPLQQKRIELGRKLYLDTRLSTTNTISCNTCHLLDQYGVDNEPTSLGHAGERGGRNSPSTYNAFLHISQFWDGRAKDVEEQALGPILNPVEMGMASDTDVIKKIEGLPEYVRGFKEVFPSEKNPLKYRNIGIVIGAFERTLVTPSRFDDYLRGDIRALSSAERKGLKKFTDIGCVSCHNGAAVGGGMYQKLGAVEDYPHVTDLGLYEITKNEDDKYFFKVPSLRNVMMTGPWFHNGSITTIEDAIEIMGRYQLGVELTSEDIRDIKTFLASLTGELPKISMDIVE